MTTDELFAQMEQNPELYLEADEYCMLESDTSRVVVVPDRWKTLGVEHDNKVERIPFKLPKVVGDNKDLSTFTIRINFMNANNQADSVPVDDVETTSDGNYITFSWLVTDSALAAKGTVGFVVYAYNGEEKWHTTLNSDCESLVGLSVGESIAEEYPDVVEEILSRLDELEKTGGATPEQIQTAVEDYLSKNPVQPGATAEQAQQIETNRQNIETKLDKNQGTENSGKFLGIDETGDVVPTDAPSGGGSQEVDAYTKQESDERYAQKTEIPKTLPNPNKIKFTGAVTAEYDGSSEVTVDIPEGVSGGGEGTVSVSVSETITGEEGTDAKVENVGTSQNVQLKFTIPKGKTGETGQNGQDGSDGKSATVSIGTVTTGEPGTDASVENVGSETDAILNITIPRGDTGGKGEQGDKGDTGSTPNIQIGEVTTLESGQQATASITGTSENPILNLGIPKGERGQDVSTSEPYELPIMSDTQLGGGKAVAKTNETVAVAVDTETGQLFVPTYPEAGNGSNDSEWTKLLDKTIELQEPSVKIVETLENENKYSEYFLEFSFSKNELGTNQGNINIYMNGKMVGYFIITQNLSTLGQNYYIWSNEYPFRHVFVANSANAIAYNKCPLSVQGSFTDSSIAKLGELVMSFTDEYQGSIKVVIYGRGVISESL